MEKISVIIPVYNVERYIRHCVDTVRGQTYKNLEIILVDDGSTDSSGTICEEYAEMDARCIVIHQTNSGLGSARNTGIEAATGEYLGFVDSDDWIALDMYERLYGLCESYGCDIAVGGIKRVFSENESDEKKVEHLIIYSQEEFLRQFFRVNTQNSDHYAVNKLYKGELFKRARYPEGVINEDVEGTFRVLLDAKKIVSTDQITYFYRINPDSITNRRFDDAQFDLITVWENVWRISQKYCGKELQYYAMINRYRADFGVLCKLAISDLNRNDLKKLKNRKNKLIDNLRKNYGILIKAPIPKGRKMIMTLFCVNYSLFSKLIWIGYHIRKKRVSQRIR